LEGVAILSALPFFDGPDARFGQKNSGFSGVRVENFARIAIVSALIERNEFAFL